jgi:hypothetical protein
MGPGFGGGARSALNVQAARAFNTTGNGGAVFTVCVNHAGTSVGALYDHTTVAGLSEATLIGIVPEAVGVYSFNAFPYSAGLVFSPGNGHVVSIAYT